MDQEQKRIAEKTGLQQETYEELADLRRQLQQLRQEQETLHSELQKEREGNKSLRVELQKAQEENEILSGKLQQAQDANMAKETFLSNMSHDIRTPMNAIIGMTMLAEKHIDEKSRVTDALDKIETASTHLLSLINDVLDMSRINSGRMQIVKEPFYLGDLLHDVLTIIRPQMDERGHVWHLDTEHIMAECLLGDPLRLRQIYVNIINNAVKYTKPGGKIHIEISQKAGESNIPGIDEKHGQGSEDTFSGRTEEALCHVIFTCRDNGLGMSREFLDRIFEPFERVNNSTVSGIEGTGLGMSIVKKLVEAMDGTIYIESAEGKGTEVTIDIPMKCKPEEEKIFALEGKQLLILEADESLRSLYESYLGAFGLHYSCVSSAAEALSAMTDASFSGKEISLVVIGEKQEDGGSKYAVASYLHKADPRLPIVLVSSDNWEEMEYQANRSGIRSFIPVPFFRKSLVNGLNAALLGENETENISNYIDLSGCRILLVEDNLINREIAGEILGSTGAEIDAAEDGKQALESYLSHPAGWYLMILMDVQMPVMDGYASTRAIRGSGRGDALTIPIFAMTANTFAEDIAKARQAGMDGHIAKPVDVNTLMQVLRQVKG